MSPSPRHSGSPTGSDGRPTGPKALAARFTRNERDLLDDISAWRSGAGRRPAAKAALREQKLFRRLVGGGRAADKAIAALPPRLRAFAGPIVEAQRALAKLTVPVHGTGHLVTRRPLPPKRLLDYYRSAARRFGVPWDVLAAVNFVESKFGRILGPSTSGARGPMQFIPSTWDAYGNGGDIDDPHDSIMAAARYLSASGAPERMRAALFSYNHAAAYVNAVLIYARAMRSNRVRFFDFYLWQVFVSTTHGVVQLTGPGGRRS